MKKKWIIIISVILGLTLIGFGIFKFYIKPKLVDFAFNQIISTAMSGIADTPDASSAPDASVSQSAQEQPSGGSGESPETSSSDTPSTSLTPQEKAAQMPASEVARIVSATPSLMSELEKIVSPADKERVLNIALSNFSKEEISKYAAKVASGITSAEKTELINMARSRISSAQWSECMQILYKYTDQLRPIIAKNMS